MMFWQRRIEQFIGSLHPILVWVCETKAVSWSDIHLAWAVSFEGVESAVVARKLLLLPGCPQALVDLSDAPPGLFAPLASYLDGLREETHRQILWMARKDLASRLLRL